MLKLNQNFENSSQLQSKYVSMFMYKLLLHALFVFIYLN